MTDAHRTPQVSHQTRLDILEAAADAFAARGYHGVSMRDLARETGRSLGAFYNHFDSKEALLFSLQRDAFDQLIDSSRQALAGVDGPASRLYLFILNHLHYIAARPAIMRVLVHEAGALDGPRRSAVRERKEAYFAIAREIVGAIICTCDDAELERSTYCVFGMLNWTYGWYTPKVHGAPEILGRDIHRIALRGLTGSAHEDTPFPELESRLDEIEIRPLIAQSTTEVK